MDNITDILKQEFQKLNDKVDNTYVELKQGQEEIKLELKEFKEVSEKNFKQISNALHTFNLDNNCLLARVKLLESRMERLEAKVV